MDKSIYLSKERILMGVSGGLAKHFDISVNIVRLLWILTFVFTGGIILVVYIVLGIVLPNEPEEEDNKKDIYDI